MNNHLFRIDAYCSEYLEALEKLDYAYIEHLWTLTASIPGLEEAFQELHAGILLEEQSETQKQITADITSLVQEHMPSAEVIPSSSLAISVAAVVEEILRDKNNRLSADEYERISQLSQLALQLPEELGFSKLKDWAERQFGPAPTAVWKAFQQAAMRLEFRRAAAANYSLAARTPKREE